LLALANDVLIDGARNSVLTRIDGIILMYFFVIFVYYTIFLAKAEKNNHNGYHKHGILKSVIMMVAGILGLAYGGKWVVDGAVMVASEFGVSEALIGLTVVAVGTSLPELATSAVAAYRKNADIAIGNVVGSNIFNVFWVLGISAAIKPLPFRPEISVSACSVCLRCLLIRLLMTARISSSMPGRIIISVTMKSTIRSAPFRRRFMKTIPLNTPYKMILRH
jgi:cation:H+ antiporter